MYEVIYFRKGQYPQLHSRWDDKLKAVDKMLDLLGMYSDVEGFSAGIRLAKGGN